MFSLGLSTSSTALVVSKEDSFRSAFTSRVIVNGGTVESGGCAVTALRGLTKEDSNVDILRAFESRVFTNGGTMESNTCALSSIKELTVAHSNEITLLNEFRDRVELDGGSLLDPTGAYDFIDALT